MGERKPGGEWAQVRFITRPHEIEELWEYAKDPRRQLNLLVFVSGSPADFLNRTRAFLPRIGHTRMVGIHRFLMGQLAKQVGVPLGERDALVLRQRREGDNKLPAQKLSASNDSELVRKVGDRLFEETLGAGSAREEARKRRKERLERLGHSRLESPKAATSLPEESPVTPAVLEGRHSSAQGDLPGHSDEPRGPVPRRAATNAVSEGPVQAPRRAKQTASTSYRAFWPVEGPVVTTVRAELLEWLDHKGVPAALVEAEEASAEVDGRAFEWAFDVGQADGARALALTMREPSEGSTFTTEVRAYEGSDGASWVFLRVFNDAGRFAATPRLARSLIRALQIREREHRLTNKPRNLSASSLLALLEDPQRRLPVVVTATDERLNSEESGAFLDLVADWTSSITGQAHLITLDPRATAEFNQALDKELRVWPWAMRIYRPGFARDEADQAPDHRYLSTMFLAQAEPSRVRGRLIALARTIAQQGEVPSELSKAALLLERVALERQQDALRARAQEHASIAAAEAEAEETAAPTTPAARLMTELSHFILGLYEAEELTQDLFDEIEDKLTAPDLSGSLKETRAQLLQREDEKAELELLMEMIRDDADKELDVLERRLDLATRERNFYQQELAKKDNKLAYRAYEDRDPLEGIDDIETVLQRCRELKYVEVTWDEDIVREIPEWDKHDIVPKGAWRALLALEEYGRRACGEEGFNGNFLDYVSQELTLLGPSKVAMRESNATMQQFGDERLFRVPTSIDPSGISHMQAHIRIGSASGGLATRMHFLDDTANTGKIYVGYLGEHLSNTQTRNR